MLLLHAQYGVKFIVVCQAINRSLSTEYLSYNDRVALLNRYLSVVLETLSLIFPYLEGMESTSIIRVNMLPAIGITGVPFYMPCDLLPFHCHPRRTTQSSPQLILGSGYSPLLRFKHMQNYMWNFCFHILRLYSMFLVAALHL